MIAVVTAAALQLGWAATIAMTAVVAAMAAMSTSGAVPTMLPLLWCSETQ